MAALTHCTRFLVAPDDLRSTRWSDEPIPRAGADEIVVVIDRFAFTANNVTYAEMGKTAGFWHFFPGPTDRACIPVWGFAVVVDSQSAQIAIGERIYGFLPMATHLLLRPERIDEASFVDASTHRQSLPSAYNLYLRSNGDPAYRQPFEDIQTLFRPVFITSFLIDDLLAEASFYAAGRVMVSSASSKTALGLAYLLRERPNVEVVGLTSRANVGFVESTTGYDAVVSYDDIDGLSLDSLTAFVDLAGSPTLRKRVHEQLDDRLTFSLAVGFTHRLNPLAPDPPPGVAPTTFFAANHLRRRARNWGRDGLSERITCQWLAFAPTAQGWVTPVLQTGRAAVESIYARALAGQIAPSTGCILSLTSDIDY